MNRFMAVAGAAVLAFSQTARADIAPPGWTRTISVQIAGNDDFCAFSDITSPATAVLREGIAEEDQFVGFKVTCRDRKATVTDTNGVECEYGPGTNRIRACRHAL